MFKLDIITKCCIFTRKPNACVSVQGVLVRSGFRAKSAKSLADTSGGVPTSCAPPASVRSTLPVPYVNVTTSSVEGVKKTEVWVCQPFISGVVVEQKRLVNQIRISERAIALHRDARRKSVYALVLHVGLCAQVGQRPHQSGLVLLKIPVDTSKSHNLTQPCSAPSSRPRKTSQP